jgi:hypothetical protein
VTSTLYQTSVAIVMTRDAARRRYDVVRADGDA